MTMVYARIADTTVADEYFDVAAQVDELYAHRRTPGASMTFDPEAPTPIELTRAAAIVLFDWLHRDYNDIVQTARTHLTDDSSPS